MKNNFNLARKEKPTGKLKDLKKPKFFRMKGRQVVSNLDVFFNTLKALKTSEEQSDYINDLCDEYKKSQKKEVEKFMNLPREDILRFLVYSQMNQADLDSFEFAMEEGFIVKNPLAEREVESQNKKVLH